MYTPPSLPAVRWQGEGDPFRWSSCSAQSAGPVFSPEWQARRPPEKKKKKCCSGHWEGGAAAPWSSRWPRWSLKLTAAASASSAGTCKRCRRGVGPLPDRTPPQAACPVSHPSRLFHLRRWPPAYIKWKKRLIKMSNAQSSWSHQQGQLNENPSQKWIKMVHACLGPVKINKNKQIKWTLNITHQLSGGGGVERNKMGGTPRWKRCHFCRYIMLGSTDSPGWCTPWDLAGGWWPLWAQTLWCRNCRCRPSWWSCWSTHSLGPCSRMCPSGPSPSCRGPFLPWTAQNLQPVQGSDIMN